MCASAIRTGRYGRAIVAGFVIGVSTVVRTNNGIVLVGLGLAVLAAASLPWRTRLGLVLAIGFGSFGPLAAFASANYVSSQTRSGDGVFALSFFDGVSLFARYAALTDCSVPSRPPSVRAEVCAAGPEYLRGDEVALIWGRGPLNDAMARPDVTPIVMVGDGTYLMMNSEIYSSVLTGHKFVLIVCDNGGFAVINRLQNAKGTPGFNNLIRDCKVVEPFAVDFVRHAESMGAAARRCDSLADLAGALDWARGTDRTTVISIDVDAFTWTPGDADWDVGVPAVSEP